MLKNNDIIRRLRYALDLKDSTLVEIFKLGGVKLTREQVLDILKRQEDEDFLKCDNKTLEAFLDGFIAFKRGKREDQSKHIEKITKNNINNLIMKKLKIALSLRSNDVMEILSRAGVHISNGELSAIYRNPEHKNYRECGDRYVRNFLKGLTILYRGE